MHIELWFRSVHFSFTEVNTVVATSVCHAIYFIANSTFAVMPCLPRASWETGTQLAMLNKQHMARNGQYDIDQPEV